MTGPASPVPVPHEVWIHDGPALLEGVDDGPSLVAHRERYRALPDLGLPELQHLVGRVGLRGRGGAAFPFATKLESGKSYTVVVETGGDEMRVTIDGKPAGYLKSPGIGHATKSKIELGVAGKDGMFDDIKVWNAEPAK